MSEHQHESLEFTDQDSFILRMLRGWRLLRAASLSDAERRDVLAASQNRTDYQSVVQALKSLWDENAVSQQPQRWNESMAFTQGLGWEEDAWESPQRDSMGYTEDEWTAYFLNQPDGVDVTPEPPTPYHDEDIPQDQLNALQEAEVMAMESQRTLQEAREAVATARRDRGFGQEKEKTAQCWLCGSPDHQLRQCPDRSSPKGRGKLSALQAKYRKGVKGSRKGKGKGMNTMMYQDMFDYECQGLEMLSEDDPSLNLFLSSGLPQSSYLGMMDCGATASAGSRQVCSDVTEAVRAADENLKVEEDDKARPFFRYGNGEVIRADCKITLTSWKTGAKRVFELFRLPLPPHIRIPLLVGMSFLYDNEAKVDFKTSEVTYTKFSEDRIKLPVNAKGHLMIDIVQYLTGVEYSGNQIYTLEQKAKLSKNDIVTIQDKVSNMRQRISSFRQKHGMNMLPTCMVQKSTDNFNIPHLLTPVLREDGFQELQRWQREGKGQRETRERMGAPQYGRITRPIVCDLHRHRGPSIQGLPPGSRELSTSSKGPQGRGDPSLLLVGQCPQSLGGLQPLRSPLPHLAKTWAHGINKDEPEYSSGANGDRPHQDRVRRLEESGPQEGEGRDQSH